jgi:hypothetical protein
LSAAPALDAVFERIYSFDFASGRVMARAYAAQDHRDPLGHAVVAAAELFAELERLQLLTPVPAGIKMKGRPDPAVRVRIQDAARLAEEQGQRLLVKDPNDPQALLALMLVCGIERDYRALVEQRYRQSWVSARRAQEYALRLTRTQPAAHDARFTIGFTDYLVSSAPFFLKPFMKMEAADGNRERAIANLRQAAFGGRYLKGFAQLILARIYHEDRRYAEAEEMLRLLVTHYPGNTNVSRQLGRAAQGLAHR